jgi:parvulin-like peptidyl-prolyl isomerase
MKIRRILIIAAIVFLVGIVSWVGYGYYKDRIQPFREVVIKVNDTSFDMGYFVKMLDAYTGGINSTTLYSWGEYFADMVADNIIHAELLRQGAKNLGIEVTADEIDEELEEREWPDDRVYRDIASATLLQNKLENHFDSQLPDAMEQAHIQIMLVENQVIADEVTNKIEGGGNFTALAKEFSCNSSVEGDLGWLPRELMPNAVVADVAFNLTVGEISQPIYDETTTKEIGYWLIEVTDKQTDKIKARAILLGSKAEAEQVKAELAAGGNFSSLAKEYSQHKSRTQGGELGVIKRGDMGSSAFDQVAFSLPLNEISEPVTDKSALTTGGYWLIKVMDRGERELAKETRESLVDKHLNDLLEECKEDSTIENLLDKTKKMWAVNEVLKGR